MLIDTGSPFRVAQFKYDNGGQVRAHVKLHRDIEARRLVKVVFGEQGYRTVPLEHEADRYHIGFIERPGVISEVRWVQIGGPVQKAFVPVSVELGDRLFLEGGALCSTERDPYGVLSANQFAYVTKIHEAKVCDLYLIPELIYDRH